MGLVSIGTCIMDLVASSPRMDGIAVRSAADGSNSALVSCSSSGGSS